MSNIKIKYKNQPIDGDKIKFKIYSSDNINPITFDNNEAAIDLTFNQNTTITRKAFAVLNDSTSVSDIDLETLINSGYVIDAVTDGNYFWLAGNFSLVGGSISKLVKIDASGTIMQHWGNTINNTVRKLYLQDDGKLLVGGDFTSFNGTTVNRLTRLNVGGSIDTTFNSNVVTANRFDNLIYDIKVRTDGKILVGGSFNRGICELNANGTPTSILFNNSGYGTDNTVRTISLIEGNDSFFIGGDFTEFNSIAVGYIAKIGSGGTYVTMFGTGFDSSVYKILSAPNNPTQLIISSPASYYNGVACKGGIFKINSSTNTSSLTIDTNFRNAVGDGVINTELIYNIEPITRESFIELNNIETAYYNNYNNLLMITGSFEYFNRKPSKRVYIIDEDGNDVYLTAKPTPLDDDAYRTRTPVFNVGVANDFVYKVLQLNNKFYLFGNFSLLRGYVTNDPLNNLSIGEFKKYTNTFEWNFANIPTGTDVQVDFAIENSYGAQNVSFYFNPTSGGVNKVYTPDIPTMITNFKNAIVANFYLYDFGYKFNFTIVGNSLKLEILSDFSNCTYTYTEYESMSFAAGTFNQSYIGELEQTIINTFIKLNYGGYFTSDLENWCTWKDDATEVNTLIYKASGFSFDVNDLPGKIEINDPEALFDTLNDILCRSAFILKGEDNISDTTVFSLKLWNGEIDASSLVYYQTTKQKLASTQKNNWISPSRLLKEKFVSDIDNYISNDLIVDISETEIKYALFSIKEQLLNVDVITNTKVFLTLDGYSDKNIHNIPDLLVTNNIIQVAKNSDYRIWFKTKELTNIIVNDIDISYIPDNSLIDTKQVKGLKIDTMLDFNKIEFVYTTGSQFIYIYTIEECRNDIFNVLYKNKYGVLNTISFNKKHSKTLNITKNDYQKSNLDINGDYNKYGHTNKSYNVNNEEEITLNSGYVRREMNESFKDLIISEEVYIQEGSEIYPVGLQENNFDIKNDKYELISYTIKFKKSNKKIW